MEHYTLNPTETQIQEITIDDFCRETNIRKRRFLDAIDYEEDRDLYLKFQRAQTFGDELHYLFKKEARKALKYYGIGKEESAPILDRLFKVKAVYAERKRFGAKWGPKPRLVPVHNTTVRELCYAVDVRKALFIKMIGNVDLRHKFIYAQQDRVIDYDLSIAEVRTALSAVGMPVGRADLIIEVLFADRPVYA